MKKYAFYFSLLFLLFMIFPIIRFFHKEHQINYTVDHYSISESYYHYNGKKYYDFIVRDGKKIFSFTLDKSIENRKKVLRSIKSYQEGDVLCIQSFYKKIEDYSFTCLKNSKQVSSYVLRDDSNYLKILEKINKDKINKDFDYEEEYEKLKVYPNHISDYLVYYIWNYKGIYVLKKGNISYQKILDFDLYENIMATTVNQYFVLFDNSSVNGIEKVYYYDSVKEKLHMFQLNTVLAKDSYINGVRDSYLYVTDKRNKLQYRINLKKEKIELVGNEESQYITYHNHDMIRLNKSDFFMKNQLFDNEFENNLDQHKDSILENNKYYYEDDGTFYREMFQGNRVELFHKDFVTEWKVFDGNILVVDDDILYTYSDSDGFVEIVQYNELLYNYTNIYYVGR